MNAAKISGERGQETALLLRTLLIQILIAAFVGFLSVLIAQMAFDNRVLEPANAVCFVLFVVLSLANVAFLIVRDPFLVWSPIPAFILSSILFLGFGPLAYFFGNDATLLYLSIRPPSATMSDLNRVLTLTMAGQVGFYIGIYAIIAAQGRGAIQRLVDAGRYRFSPETLAFAFTGVGLAFKYLLFIPSTWGLIDLEVPGFLVQINALASLGFGLWAFVAFRRGGAGVLVFLLVLAVDIALTSLGFAKRYIMLDLIFPLAGYYLARRNRPVTIAAAAFIAMVFVVSQPFVIYGRIAVGGETAVAGFSERAKIAADYLQGEGQIAGNVNYEGSQRWWTRLDAAGRQAFAMHLRDVGEESHSLTNLAIIFIPRIFWLDKPVIEPPGRQFYYLVTGRSNNNMAPTLYGDLYWLFGWLGVILVTPLCGALLGYMHSFLIDNIRQLNFTYIPAVLIALKSAIFDPQGFLINGFLVTFPTFIIYIVLIAFFANLTGARNVRATVPG